MTENAAEPRPKAPVITPLRLGWAAVAIATAALVLAALPWLSGGSFDARVRSALVGDPQILVEASEALNANQSRQQVAAIEQAARNNPALLAVGPGDAAFGPETAQVTVVEFFDFQCPGCKAVAPDYLRLMAAHPEARFVFRDWPILDRGDSTTSNYAARAALAAHRQGRYREIYQALMSQGALDEASIDALLVEAGVDLARARADMTSPDTARRIADTEATAAALQLFGTPTFFVNGRPMASIDPAQLEQAIEAAKRG